MTFNDVLVELIESLRAETKSVLISWDTVQHWPEGALETFLQLGLLIPAPAAQSIECHACENHCFMDVLIVQTDSASTRAFIVCDDTDMQSQIGRVSLPLDRLHQWQGSVNLLSGVIAGVLGLKDKIHFAANQSVIKLGMLQSKRGRRWVTFNSSDLSLEVNHHSRPIEELLYFDEQRQVIDQNAIDELLDRDPLNISKKYTPSITKRELRKLETFAMHQNWQDEFLRLKGVYPNKPNTWHAARIAKMDIAKGKDAETIRKIMVK